MKRLNAEKKEREREAHKRHLGEAYRLEKRDEELKLKIELEQKERVLQRQVKREQVNRSLQAKSTLRRKPASEKQTAIRERSPRALPTVASVEQVMTFEDVDKGHQHGGEQAPHTPDSCDVSVQPPIREFMDSDGYHNVRIRTSLESTSLRGSIDNKDQKIPSIHEHRPDRLHHIRQSADSGLRKPQKAVPLYKVLEMRQQKKEETAL